MKMPVFLPRVTYSYGAMYTCITLPRIVHYQCESKSVNLLSLFFLTSLKTCSSTKLFLTNFTFDLSKSRYLKKKKKRRNTADRYFNPLGRQRISLQPRGPLPRTPRLSAALAPRASPPSHPGALGSPHPRASPPSHRGGRRSRAAPRTGPARTCSTSWPLTESAMCRLCRLQRTSLARVPGGTRTSMNTSSKVWYQRPQGVPQGTTPLRSSKGADMEAGGPAPPGPEHCACTQPGRDRPPTGTPPSRRCACSVPAALIGRASLERGEVIGCPGRVAVAVGAFER